jgi:hypothetical protein
MTYKDELRNFMEKRHNQQLYMMRNSNWFKVGISESPQYRVKQLENKLNVDIELVATWEVDNAQEVEAHLHKLLNRVNVFGEWFRLPEQHDLEGIVRGVDFFVKQRMGEP